MSTTAAVLVGLAVAGNGELAMGAVAPDLFQVTVIHKNQLHPKLGEVEARAAERRTKGEANSVHGIVPKPQGQWI